MDVELKMEKEEKMIGDDKEKLQQNVMPFMAHINISERKRVKRFVSIAKNIIFILGT